MTESIEKKAMAELLANDQRYGIACDLAVKAFELIGSDRLVVQTGLSVDDAEVMRNFGRLQRILLMAYDTGRESVTPPVAPASIPFAKPAGLTVEYRGMERTVLVKDGRTTIAEVYTRNVPGDQYETARLFAHAPDMFAVLEKLSVPDAGTSGWPNGSNESVPRALRYLADHPRPSAGEASYNSAHLFQLADEVETAVKRTRSPLGACADAVKWLLAAVKG
ncbi:hypothetical protein G3A43_08800 [Paraburkholderia aspalathi]|nr:hypothetical protein [Paraburkholderia aspalathi]MBK3780356.1 hypothetical protein [Paraburkholderia aspalathi]